MLLFAALIWVVLNFSYFKKNLQYQFGRHPVVAPDKVAEEKMDPDQVSIPALGIVAPVVYVDEQSENTFQEALKSGVVHFPDTASPGQSGNVYLFGHSSDNPWAQGEYKTVFALLPQIEIGTEILISDSEGNTYVYKAIETKVIDSDDLSVLDQGARDRKLLTLQTSYPVGTALRRFVVVAELKD